ncbi:MAG: hypothetical protein DWQ01_22405 [Planctomycetota bacterium]|nr:MAG: hypothetical protein DWQ01_22405 [Planctomycetota bacterium]
MNWWIPFALLATFQQPSQEPEPRALHPLQGRFRFSIENLEIGRGEDMGLFGLHFDFYPLPEDLPGLFLSAGGFGAITGERGGFLVGGFGGGYQFTLAESLYLELGAFAGGGGGGAAPQGSGLMLREHLALEWQPGAIGFRLEGSLIDFPDGGIDSSQVAAGITLPLELWRARHGPGKQEAAEATPAWPIRAGLTTLWADPGSSSKRTDGSSLDQAFALMGLRVDAFPSDREPWFLSLAGHGAFAGSIDGYAQLLLGAGYELALSPSLAAELRLQTGAGGGGTVETGGGWLLSPAAGLRWYLTDHWSLQAGVGWLWAPSGDYSALSLEGGLAMAGRPLRYRPRDAGRTLPAGTSLSKWRLEFANKSYFPDSGARLKNGRPMAENLQLVGLAANRPLTPWLDFSGRAYGAWDGGSGGYAEGQVGFQSHWAPVPDWNQFELLAEGLIGAGGGGGLDVDSGLIWEAGAGFVWQFDPDWRLSATGGRAAAFQGSFEATVFRLALAWNLAMPVTSS